MLGSETAEQESNTVRYVSGLAALPSSIRDLDGLAAELVAVASLVLLIVWIFWIW